MVSQCYVSQCVRAHPPLVPERKQAGNVGGRATFFQSLEPADSCLVRPGAAAPLLGRTAATSWRSR